MLPIAQVIADWATPAGQLVVSEDLKANMRRRLELKSSGRRFDAEAFASARSRALDYLSSIAHWDVPPAPQRRAAA